MYTRSFLVASALAVAASATNFAQYATNGIQFSVNIPSSTSSSKSGPIFIQMVAPVGTQWLGLGQGSSMTGSNMFIMYADGSNNVTVSPRLGTGEQQPQFNSAATITVLEDSGLSQSGEMIANIRCDSCISWSGGSMDPTDSSSSWIWAIKAGDAIDSTSTSYSIVQHDTESGFNLNLNTGTGGSSSNPFLPAAVASGTSTASGTSSATTSGTSSSSATSSSVVTGPVPGTSGSSSSSSGSFSAPSDSTRSTHAVVMSIVFLLFFPLFALTLYLPYAKRVRFVHAPLQILSIILLLVGLGTGVKLGKSVDMLDGYHQVIGYIVVFVMIAFQPALGIYQHMHYHKTGGRSALGVFHQWLGRTVILVGIVNGGLGFMQSGAVGTTNVPHYSVVAYSIVAVVVFIIYVAVVVASKFRAKGNESPREKIGGRAGYEMHPSTEIPRQQYHQGNSGYQNDGRQTYQNPSQGTYQNPRQGYGQRPNYR